MRYLLSALAIAIILSSCANQKGMKKDEKAKDKSRMTAFYDQVMNAHNPAAVDSFCAPDYVEHAPDPGFTPDREGLKRDLASLFTAFPDMHVRPNIITSDSDIVSAQITFTGTNSGSFMGMPATGKVVNVDGIDMIRMKNGMAVEHWGYIDWTKMMQQLGMMPPMAAPSDTSNMKMK